MKSVQLEFKEVKEKVMDGLDMADLDVRRVDWMVSWRHAQVYFVQVHKIMVKYNHSYVWKFWHGGTW